MNKINKKYELIFVLDPSKDQSENIIISEIEKNSKSLSYSKLTKIWTASINVGWIRKFKWKKYCFY